MSASSVQYRLLSDLLADLAFLSDLPTFTTTTFVTKANAIRLLNQGLFEMYRAIVDAAGTTAYRKTTTITTTANTYSYNLPADCYEVAIVEQRINTVDRVHLERFTLQERALLLSSSPGWTGEAFKYCVIGKSDESQSPTGQESIEFLPIPATGTIIDVHYIWGPKALVNDSDPFGGFAGFEDYGVLWAAKRIAIKGEKFELAANLGAELERQRGILLGDMRSIDASNPPRVQLTRGSWTGGHGTRWRRW